MSTGTPAAAIVEATPEPPQEEARASAAEAAEPSQEADEASASSAPSTADEPRVHVVQPGEYLAEIARKYGVDLQSLIAANRLSNPNLLYAGQRLVIPDAQRRTTGSEAAAGIQAPTERKWIDVNVTTQTLNAYEGDRLVFTATVSTGLPRTPTVLGRFRIRTKLRSQTMYGPGYYLPDVPYVMYFYGAYAIHGTYWHNNFGQPMSRGCVNMRIEDAKWLYEWAPLGTLVVVHR